MSKYKLGKMSFEKKESKELFILRHLLSDYEYLLKMNKTILSDGDKDFVQREGWNYYWWRNRFSINLGHDSESRGL